MFSLLSKISTSKVELKLSYFMRIEHNQLFLSKLSMCKCINKKDQICNVRIFLTYTIFRCLLFLPFFEPFSPDLLILNSGDPLASIVESTYPNLSESMNDISYF